MALFMILGGLAATGAFITFVDSQGTEPAPYAPSDLSLAARIRHYLSQRRFWDLFQGLHIMVWVMHGFMALEAGDWSLAMPTRESVIGNAEVDFSEDGLPANWKTWVFSDQGVNAISKWFKNSAVIEHVKDNPLVTTFNKPDANRHLALFGTAATTAADDLFRRGSTQRKTLRAFIFLDAILSKGEDATREEEEAPKDKAETSEQVPDEKEEEMEEDEDDADSVYDPAPEDIEWLENWAQETLEVSEKDAVWEAQAALLLSYTAGENIPQSLVKERARKALEMDPESWAASYALSRVVESKEPMVSFFERPLDEPEEGPNTAGEFLSDGLLNSETTFHPHPLFIRQDPLWHQAGIPVWELYLDGTLDDLREWAVNSTVMYTVPAWLQLATAKDVDPARAQGFFDKIEACYKDFDALGTHHIESTVAFAQYFRYRGDAVKAKQILQPRVTEAARDAVRRPHRQRHVVLYVAQPGLLGDARHPQPDGVHGHDAPGRPLALRRHAMANGDHECYWVPKRGVDEIDAVPKGSGKVEERVITFEAWQDEIRARYVDANVN
ncbi:hypothetical protein ACJZ2D_001054 [Fusarium nematophilum]